MIEARHCIRCREDVAPDQAECPACGDTTKLLSDLACGYCGRSDVGVEIFTCGKGGCPLGGDL